MVFHHHLPASSPLEAEASECLPASAPRRLDLALVLNVVAALQYQRVQDEEVVERPAVLARSAQARRGSWHSAAAAPRHR
jgi:hypothetical protein